jgi:hypothetical protein
MGTSLRQDCVEAIQAAQPLSLERLRAHAPEARRVLLVVLGAIEPRTFPLETIETGEAHSSWSIDGALIGRWAERLVDAGRGASLAEWVVKHGAPASAALRGVRRAIDRGELDIAQTLARSIPWYAKLARAYAMIHLWRATGREELAAEAVSAIVDGEAITHGTGHGFDELEMLGRILPELRALGPRHPIIATILGRIERYARDGQRRSEPIAFGKSLGAIAVATANDADAAHPGWLDGAVALRAALLFAEDAAVADEAIAAARSRIDRGELSSRPVVAPAAPSLSRGDWRASAHFEIRALGATEEIALLDLGDPEGALPLLVEIFEPSAQSYPGALAAFERSEGAARERALLDVVRTEPTDARRWCTTAPEAVWDAISRVEADDTLRAIVDALFDRGFVVLAHPGADGSHTPRSISSLVVRASSRLGEPALIERVLEVCCESQSLHAARRLFDAISALPIDLPFVLTRWEPRVPADRRWALWGAIAHARLSIAECTERFGPLDRSRVHAIARALAAADRVNDAIAIAEHEHAYPTDEGRPPPMQDALLEIARSGAPLDAKQKKALVARMKKAPRLRAAGEQARYKSALAELEALVAGASPG